MQYCVESIQVKKPIWFMDNRDLVLTLQKFSWNSWNWHKIWTKLQNLFDFTSFSMFITIVNIVFTTSHKSQGFCANMPISSVIAFFGLIKLFLATLGVLFKFKTCEYWQVYILDICCKWKLSLLLLDQNIGKLPKYKSLFILGHFRPIWTDFSLISYIFWAQN